MFWNKKILTEKKEITLINRILDLIELDTTGVLIEEGYMHKRFNYPFNKEGNVGGCCMLTVEYNKIQLTISYIQKYSTSDEWFYIINQEDQGIQITKKEFYQIKEAIEKHIERSILVSLYPFQSPELETVFNDVRKIQDGKEQIDFITNEIKKIQENYAK